MSKTKEKIASAAKSLFNSEGYGSVTIRMIALKLDMSSGNLNYHFKKKEDILESLYFDMVTEFDRRIAELGTAELSLESIKADIESSMERMLEYVFFWTDLYNLLRSNQKIAAHFESVYEKRVAGYQFMLNSLLERGLMCGFEFQEEANLLIERMINFSDTWIYASALYHKKIDNVYLLRQASQLISMLYPYLSQAGKEEYRKIYPHYFVESNLGKSG